jgi:plastocyanin
VFRAVVTLCFATWAPSVWGATAAFSFRDGKGKPIQDAVVSLTPLDAPVPAATKSAPVEIMQKGQEFIPYVTPLQVGAAVIFPNRDTVQHHVYSLSKPKKFELPLYAGEAKDAIVFDQPGVVALGCNIHDWMSAYVIVLGTPWFAKSGADGTASIVSAPAGRYRAEVWHPRLAKSEAREITLSETSAEPQRFTLALKQDRRIRRSPASSSGSYK